MDLIYEGITTTTSFTYVSIASFVRMDLIYEGITTIFASSGLSTSLVRMDLIYEGITTSMNVEITLLWSSEWTWFTKGLRR